MGRRLEMTAAAAACVAAALLASWRLLQPGVFSEDAFVHQYWMWHFRDAALFDDPLTHALRESARYPVGYQALFWLPAQVVSPIVFGEWLGVALMALSGFLVFLIARAHTDWRPAAWIAAALFLALVDVHRFHGGFQRAFVHPVVLSTVLLSLRGVLPAAALVAACGALVYPPAALLAVVVLGLCALEPRRPWLDRRRAAWAIASGALAAAAVLVPEWIAGGAAHVLTRAQAHTYPEFGPHGTLRFFAPSLLEYLRQNRSGFDLRTSGSLLVLAAIAILAVRPANLRLLRREVRALPVAALLGWGAAQAVLFRLYLPHRYTYPIVAFAAIALAVCLRPTWAAVWRRPGRAPAVAAVATGLVLAGAVLAAGQGARGFACPHRAATAYLAGLPKDAVIAGDPADLECLPATTRRAVVISTQLAPSYEPAYLDAARVRMFAMLRAYYGPDRAAITALRERYRATVLYVRRNALAAGGLRWKAAKLPYGAYVRRLLDGGEEPAALHLPDACLRWSRGAEAVYDLACVSVNVP